MISVKLSVMSLFYKEAISSLIGRFLSLGDSNIFSPTFGCFDRNYWHYRTITDFPSAPFQMAALSLALLYKIDFEGNFCFQNPQILSLAEGSLLFWASIQRKDGSFDEWYPYEHSFVATAFTSYGVSEALLLLKDEISPRVYQESLEALKKAGSWLSRHDDLIVSNHQAGAIPALYNLYLLTGEESYKELSREKLKKLLKVQTEEGWFPEYGGADPGYTSLTLTFLARYYQKSREVEARTAIKKALDFMVWFLHPDGSYGGEYGSRNTRYLFPSGLEILSSEFEEAAYLLQPFYEEKKLENLVSLENVDDRFLVFFFLPDYLQALAESQKGKEKPPHSFDSLPPGGRKSFPQAGLLVEKGRNFVALIGLKKGGVLKVFSTHKLIYSDSGYFGQTSSGKVVTSQWLNAEEGFHLEEKEGGGWSITLERPLVFANYSLPLKRLLIPFRLFTCLFGRSDRVMSLFAVKLKEKMILGKKKAPLVLKRKISFKEGKILLIEDEVLNQGLSLLSFGLTQSTAALPVPSSRFYVFEPPLSFPEAGDLARKLNQERKVKLKTLINLEKKEVKYTCS